MAELARERERRADAGLIGAGLDRAQGLAREAGAPGQFVLGEAARDTRAARAPPLRLVSAIVLVMTLASWHKGCAMKILNTIRSFLFRAALATVAVFLMLPAQGRAQSAPSATQPVAPLAGGANISPTGFRASRASRASSRTGLRRW